MGEQYRNSPFTVTLAAAVGYALYCGLYSPHAGSGAGAMWTFVIGGAVMLCIVAAIEVWIACWRQRNSTYQAAGPPAANPEARQGTDFSARPRRNI